MSRADRVVDRAALRKSKSAAFDRYVRRSGAVKLAGQRLANPQTREELSDAIRDGAQALGRRRAR